VRQWADATSGKTFETLNPATGEVLVTAAEGDAAEDITEGPRSAGPLKKARGA
jgi:acyl-CoA reductase-like NAD-dependent aldehyde dehydrogenase